MPKTTELYLHEISAQEALKILHDNGSRIGLQRLYAGIRQGVFPWGICIDMEDGKKPCYTVFYAPLMRWIEERAEVRDIPEWIQQVNEEAAKHEA